MGKSEKLINSLSSSPVSRRSFMKGMAALGAMAMVNGCSVDKGDVFNTSGQELPNNNLSNPKIYYAGCVHNCGAGERCVSKVHVVNGRIVRVTTDESDYAYDGSLRNKNQYNDSRALTCPKGRAYKYRVYHPGRLQYVLKQTKTRGDMSGFIRISPEQAMKEIAQKYRAVYTKYGAGAIYNTYGTSASYGGTFSNPANARAALTSVGSTRSAFSDYSYHQYNYANPLTGHPDIAGPYVKKNNIGANFHAMAGGAIKNLVSWGSNVLSTNNSVSYGYIRAVEYLKANGGKAYFIGPEFTDTGVTCHTDWVKLRNYTDVALIMAMMYHMLINTFNEDGSIMANPMLDVDYIDTCVYGFFASPEYWVNKTDGTIVMSDPSDTTNYIHVQAVEAGKSLADYIMGSDNRLSLADYSAGGSYTAKQFATASGGAKRGSGSCTYPVGKDTAGSTEYQYKKDFNTPKTPEWASAITGVPVTMIQELAELYANPDNNVLTEWCGGFQKQENGVMNVFALSALLCVTKTFGKWGGGMYGPWASTIVNTDGSSSIVGSTGNEDFIDTKGITNGSTGVTVNVKQSTPSVSCTQWSNGIKFAFKDVLSANGYTAANIPDWDFAGGDRYSNDDAGVKAGVVWKRDETGKILTYTDTTDQLEYYDYEGRESGTPTYAGTRMIISAAGGIPVNQNSNTNDTTAMYKALPISGDPTNADTFCLVTFDVFLSPTARFADYVIPSTVALEAADTMSIGGETIYRPAIVKPNGDAKSGWEWAYLAYKAQSELGDFTGATVPADAAAKYVQSTDGNYRDVEDLGREAVNAKISDPTSRFYGMTEEQVYANEYIPRKNTDEIKTSDPYKPDTSGSIRKNLEAYLASAEKATTPFIFTKNGEITNKFDAEVYSSVRATASTVAASLDNRPAFSGRMHVYNGAAVWDYENRLSKYHGWLPAEKRGQSNKDREGDMIVYPIPMYIAFEDCFKEAYDGFSNGKNASFFSGTGLNKPLTMSTTHDRFRVHSTHDENPLMRELNHRVVGGGWASGNDWKQYAVMPTAPAVDASVTGIDPMISSAIYNANKTTASWHEIWIGTEDANERGIQDGMLCIVENPIGKVRVIARVTNRCMKGHLNLHQGGWYDPNPIDGVDDGGCANTLMSSHPSRYDRGNAQQFAYVTIKPAEFTFK